MISLKDVLGLGSSNYQDFKLPENYLKSQYPYPNEILVNKDRQGTKALKLVHTAFAAKDQIYIICHSALGDCITQLGIIQSLAWYKAQHKPSLQITVLIPDYVYEYYQSLSSDLLVRLLPIQDPKNTAMVKSKITSDAKDKDFLSLDFSYRVGKPTVDQEKNSVYIWDLLTVTVGLYQTPLFGQRRFGIFLADLLGIKPLKVTTQIKVPEHRTHLKQVAIIIESSYPVKRYSLKNWQKVVLLLLERRPDVNLKVIYKAQGSYSEKELIQTFSDRRVNLLQGSLSELTNFLAGCELVISNDTGLSHIATAIAGGPKAIVLYIPKLPPEIWTSNIEKTVPILPPAKLTDTFDYDRNELDETKKWINKIKPEQVVVEALKILR